MSKLSRMTGPLVATVFSAAVPFATAQTLNIGEVTALIAAASTSDEADELLDGKSGDIDFPYIGRMKAIATVGEVDPNSGNALTGYPDGQAAWLANENTVRMVYQSESALCPTRNAVRQVRMCTPSTMIGPAWLPSGCGSLDYF